MKINTQRITIHPRPRTNWVHGTYLGHRYEAKIFTEPSTFGISNGHVSKLWIDGIVNYDRGWDQGQEKETLWKPLLEKLTDFAKSNEFAASLGLVAPEA